MCCSCTVDFLFFFNDTATTEIYTLSLHDALPILAVFGVSFGVLAEAAGMGPLAPVVMSATTFAGSAQFAAVSILDRKSTRLNSSHANSSYAVFCLIK